jgi:type II secretory ATPase GspE/PulE/Tfp pilus assembly ATPase PilB-like protein
VALFELLEIDEPLRELVFRGGGVEEIRKLATASGQLQPLLADGARKVLAGTTSITEVLRVARQAALNR